MKFNTSKGVFPPDNDRDFDSYDDEEFSEELADELELFDEDDYENYVYTDNEEDV